jgi:hypothetical protein
MRGRPIDMAALAAANAEKIAVGNAKMNARGDILGPNGVVLQTQEQIEQEWQAAQQRQREVVSAVSSNIKAPLFPDRPGAIAEDQNFDPETSAATAAAPVNVPVYPSTEPGGNADQVKKIVQQRRKIIESDT